jgi:hypothetical protein
VAEYLLSEDRVIHEKGIEPDITLFPVSSTRLGRLASVEPDTLPYVRVTGEDDTFPIDVAEALLQEPAEEALAELRHLAGGRIQEHLEKMGITWLSEAEPPPEELPEPLRVQVDPPSLVAGQPAKFHIIVRNPNEFTISDVWAALDAPVDYLSNKLVALGTLPPDGVLAGTIELTPPDGIAVPEQPVALHIASGSHPLQSEDLVLQVTPHVPEIEIEVVRSSEERVEVTVHNRGHFGLGSMRIDVPGATRAIEDLEAGGSLARELLLSGEVESVAVTLQGPWVQRRIEVPLPEDRVSVVPPEVMLERAGLLGHSKVRVRATSPEGLDSGWIVLDGQKQEYTEWRGQLKGKLQTSFDEEDSHNVVAHVETLSGVAVTESRQLTAN